MRSLPRHLAAALTTVLLATMLVMVSPTADACACGGLVRPPGVNGKVTSETAMVTLDGGTETIAMQLDLDSDGDEIGLLMPTPAPATVSLGDETMFDDLWHASRERKVTDWHLFGPPAFFGSEDGASGAPAGASSHVRALRTVDLGPLQATTLQADDPQALETWLDRHDYRMKPGLAEQVTPYVNKKWSFVAVRLTPQGRTLDGELPPLVMRFDSDRLVYPMRMSRAAADAQAVRLYVLADHRMRRTDPSAAGTSEAEVLFAGRVAPGSVESPALRRALHKTPYVTTVEQVFTDPAQQIVSDLTFGRADSDATFHRTYTDDEYVLPIDVAVIGLLLLGGAVSGVVLLVRRRRAHPRA